MESNAEVEMRWVDAWNDLLSITGQRHDCPIQLSDFSVIDLEECKAWLQDSVYAGYNVQVTAGWVGHKQGVLVSRNKPEA